MKRLFLLASALLGLIASAAPVSQEQAQQTAASFLQTRQPGVTLKTMAKKAPAKMSNGTVTSQTAYYIFNTNANKGFVIVSGDDRTTAILGYTDSGNFDPNNIPANMQVMLDNYAQQISALDAMGYTTQMAQQAAMSMKAATSTRNSIAPMITSTWDQATPYWNKCPEFMSVEDGDTVGELAYTGCVATSMAQIMNYYKYPAQTTQEIPSYYFTYNAGNYNYTTVTMPAIPVSTIDWDHMLDSYNGSEGTAYTDAVSNLMLYVGCAVKMVYNPAASSASDPDIPTGFRNYFDYDAILKYRSDFDEATWNEMIYQELAAGRPVVYNGRAGSGGGHSFVCDGYEYGEYFHINWGWGGMGNGFFQLSVLNPYAAGIGASSSSEGYNIDQTAIIGIKPGYTGAGTGSQVDHNLTVYNMYLYINKSMKYNYTFDLSSSGIGLNKNKLITVTSEDHIDDGTKYMRGVALYDSNDNFVELIASSSYASSQLSTTDQWPQGATSTSQYFARGITSGTYKIKPVCKTSTSTGDWVPMDQSDRYYIECVFSSSTCQMTVHPISQITATNWRFTGGEKVGTPEQCTVTLTNNSADRFNDKIYLAVDGEAIDEYGQYTTCIQADINAGESKDVTFNFTPTASGTKNAEIWLVNDNGDIKATGTGTVIITTATTTTMSMSVDIEALGANQTTMTIYDSHATFKMDVTNNGAGEYNKTVLAPLFIIDENNKGSMVTYKSQAVNIQPGETKTIYFEFDNLAYGSRYAANLYARNESGSLVNLVNSGESKMYTVAHGVVVWTADGTRTGYAPSSAYTVPASAVAVQLTESTVSSVTPNSNPNTLYYIGENESVPSGLSGKNVIKGAAANGAITLRHGYDFFVPVKFTAANISYERTFTTARYAGQQGGWSTMVLPFAATNVSVGGSAADWRHSKNDNAAVWVCNYDQTESTDDGKLYADYVAADGMQAKVPYFVAVNTGNNNKAVVFSASNVTVNPDPTAITSGKYYLLRGSFINQAVSNAYLLNAAGSHFTGLTNGNVNAFEAYCSLGDLTSEQTQLQIVLDENAVTPPVGNEDINDDGVWSMADVTTLIAYILGNNPSPCLTENCDLNNDGNISMADVTTLIANILGN